VARALPRLRRVEHDGRGEAGRGARGARRALARPQPVRERRLRDRRALARYAGLTGSPDESGAKRRERGLARSGNARVRLGMIQLAWRFLWFQKDSALGRWYRERTAAAPGARKTLIVALARKLLIALWRLVREGVVPEGLRLRPAI